MHLQRAFGQGHEHFTRKQCEQGEFVVDAGRQLGHANQAVGGYIELAFIGDGEARSAARHGVHQTAHAQQLVFLGGRQANARPGAYLGAQRKVHHAQSAFENFCGGGHHHDRGLKDAVARSRHVSGETDDHDRQTNRQCDAKCG